MTTYKYGAGSIQIPFPSPSPYTVNLHLTDYQLTIYNSPDAGTLVSLSGNTTIAAGSDLTIDAYSHGSAEPIGYLQNNGTIRVSGSTLKVGGIVGKGTIIASNAEVYATSTPTSETIQVHSSHLDIGDHQDQRNPGMLFLAPVTHFDQTSSISLENTHATLEVYFRQSGAMFLFDGANMVANMTIKGSPTVYATQTETPYGQPLTILSAANYFGHAIPVHTIG